MKENFKIFFAVIITMAGIATLSYAFSVGIIYFLNGNNALEKINTIDPMRLNNNSDWQCVRWSRPLSDYYDNH